MRILIIGGTHFVGHAHGGGGPRRRPRRHPAPPQPDRRATPARPTCWPTATATCRVLDGPSWDATIDVCAYVPRAGTSPARGARGPRWPPPLRLDGLGVPGAGVARRRRGLARSSRPAADDVDGGHERDLRPAQGRLRARRSRGVRRRPAWRSSGPTYVVGPRDATARYPWWPLRAARGGPMIAARPGRGADAVRRRPRHGRVDGAARRGPRGRGLHRGPAADTTFAALLDETVAAHRQRRQLVPWTATGWSSRASTALQLPLWTEGGPEWSLAMATTARRGRRADPPAVRRGRPRHPRLGRRPTPTRRRNHAVGPGPRARAGAARRLVRHPGMSPPRPPPRRHPADDLHHDVGAGDADRRGQPRPGLPGRRRARVGAGGRARGHRGGRQPVRPRHRRRRPASGDRATPAAALRPRARPRPRGAW